MYSLREMNMGVNTEEDYEQYSNNLKENDKNYSLHHSKW